MINSLCDTRFCIRVYFLWFLGINTKAFLVYDSFAFTMTIDLSFFHEGKLVVCVNMTASNFYDKVCEITDEGLEGDMMMDIDNEQTGEEAFTDKTTIKKIWAGCLKYGYISQDHDILGLWVDKIILK